MSFKIRTLQPADLPQMYEAFMDSFFDYKVPLMLTRPQFEKKFVEKLNLSFDHSVGAFRNGKLCGFMFTSVNDYEGQKTAYNGGTGVVPEVRGNRLTHKMYQHVLPIFKAHGITQCVLEVLTDNIPAITAYQKIGFSKSKYFHCFRLRGKPSWMDQPFQYEVKTVSYPDWKNYLKFTDYLTSFLDTESMINQNIKNETVIEVYAEDRLAGYAIYQPGPGRISHLGVHKNYRYQGIGKNLVQVIHQDSKNKEISVININRDATALKAFFSKLGFENQLDQYEMKLTI